MDGAAAVFVLSLLFIGLDGAPTGKSSNWDIYSFHINSIVTSRYAITVITSRVANRRNESTEIDFHVKIPKTAFISKFRMTIDGQTYDGIVKQKEEAKKQYTAAVTRGQSAGLVSSVGRTLEDFKTSVAVAAHSKVTFELTYEELLQRRLGKYELLINAQPGQIVKDFKIDVKIYEKPGINFLEVKGSLAEKDLANAVTKLRTEKEAWAYFYPTHDQQMQCDGCGETGLNGDLKILYDVNRPLSQGDVVEHGGYFVHFFAPTDLPRIPKNVVFIIDQSGSMHGRKMMQTRDALLRILDDLAEEDYFGLILFDSLVTPWKYELLQATPRNLEMAKAFVRTITDRGATDINAAVLQGVEMINKHPREGSASILILLTDGDPTSGETNQGTIQSNVRNAIGKKFPLYCLGFGFDVNFEFLQKMAKENSGVARRIYQDSDAALQLKGFYEEVATPLLTGVQMNYTGATNLTQTTFSHYYNGSELVVAGHIDDNNIHDFRTDIIAISKHSKVMYSDIKPTKDEKLPAVMSDFENFLKRLWACLTVKQLLEKELMLTGEEKETVKKQVIDLSLKYSFVTPHTSMVVTKPQGEDSHVADKPKEGEKPAIVTTRAWAAAPGVSFRGLQHHFLHHPGFAAPDAGFSMAQLQPAPVPDARLVGTVAMDYMDYDYGHVASRSRALPFPTRTSRMIQRGRGGYGRVFGRGRQNKIRATHVPSLATATIPAEVTGRPQGLPFYFPAAPTVRFLLAADGQAAPLCFDIPAGTSLKLLQDPGSGILINGQLSSMANKGFQKIVIHINAEKYIEFNTSKIILKDGQNTTSYMWTDKDNEHIPTGDSLLLIIRENETDITIATIRVVILLHQRNGEKFLWLAIRKRPLGNASSGLIGKPPVTHEKIHATKLRIHGKEVDASSGSAQDYSIKAAPEVTCMLVNLNVALQGELSDFTVSQL
ncbi:hypothetical protein ACEWY4_013551 [Coilia grayii]|uniref:Inter-alpha-trypsin inhibitor heavy chain H3-like n=1 Tax=Coilia grayii TaxID=363190 RepID=A0ABD1JWM0_9TELE